MNSEIELLFANFKVNNVDIPVALIYYDGHADAYVVYREYTKDNSYSADDEIAGYVSIYEFDIYTKGNFIPIVEAVKEKLTLAGWTWQPRRDSPDMYEADTGFFHKSISFAYPIQMVDEQSEYNNNKEVNNMTVVKSLSKIAKLYNVKNVGENDTTDEILDKIAGGIEFGSSNVTVASPEADTDFWGTKTSDMQSSVLVANGAITGTLTKLTSGQLVTDWGEGYFLSLAFTKNNAKASDVKVGLDPSQGSGLVSLDEDMLGVFKITNKDAQKFVVVCIDETLDVAFRQTYDLSGLTLSE